MFKKRGMLLVMLSMVIAAAAAWVANNYVKSSVATAQGGNGANVTVLAAAMRIPYGTKIELRHVKTLEVPKGLLPPGAISDFKQADGSIVKSEILEGEILLKDRLAGSGAGNSLAALVAPNKRAVTVRVNDVIGVAGFLAPGNFVDVLGTRIEQNTSRRAVSETIIKMVKVLAVDQQATTDKSDAVVVRAVTLELDPGQAETLVKWEEEGTIQLALRNPTDTMVAQEPPPVAPAPVNRPRPAKRATPAPVDRSSEVILIRGTKVQNTKASS